MPQLSNFCKKCGGRIAMMVPPGENEERHVCSDCGYVDYCNPKLVSFQERIMNTSAVAACGGVHSGAWGPAAAVPARDRALQGALDNSGWFLEMGESTAAGAARETWEEASARVEIVAPYAHWDIPVIGQAYILFPRAAGAAVHICAGY
ncbi:hypothetical protein COCSUDRAFT_40300 [Coccomyxa subellipsoidea C-169]|uniref:Nudix hydrolase N-terminal domain-containing protein n=1 Tax=Coccomyxa subellipsoidea (strain C-169) TaxID=574566 RepID=I0Z689_COCSC|nr:hypothetical protein COCSUDRAFT_40300 [Coccomyxa subellipsoidea C-169]EIE26158.1 hypothetical protein COCSUDRAFT_40300 [Coccomyxa subellipsoidea C-169]|eukprot:XP_005650702.1 hypothetical protein COCSUDRAFT_40300 [Coccomyxa subellipsoidea C-169]